MALTSQIMILNEQMKLLVEYQKKQENYNHIRSILLIRNMGRDQCDMNNDIDQVTLDLLKTYVPQTSVCHNNVQSQAAL